MAGKNKRIGKLEKRTKELESRLEKLERSLRKRKKRCHKHEGVAAAEELDQTKDPKSVTRPKRATEGHGGRVSKTARRKPAGSVTRRSSKPTAPSDASAAGSTKTP